MYVTSILPSSTRKKDKTLERYRRRTGDGETETGTETGHESSRTICNSQKRFEVGHNSNTVRERLQDRRHKTLHIDLESNSLTMTMTMTTNTR